jgi:hypothetical protein
MKRAPLTYRRSPRSKEERARFQQMERDFRVRAFGEDLARVILDLSTEERRRYLYWMRQTARQGREATTAKRSTEQQFEGARTGD